MIGSLTALLALTVAVDGRLDEPAWRTAAWTDGVAVLADAQNVYVGVRGDRADVSLAPSGTAFDFYRFSVDEKGATAAFFSEGGAIQPDPYAPAWSHATAADGKGRSFEMVLPLSAFYLTRTADWKTRWLVRCGNGKFAAADGFPVRDPAEDVFVRTATADIGGVADGRFVGTLKLDVLAARAGEFLLRTSAGSDEKRVDLKAGANLLTIGCAYPAKGRQPTRIALKPASGGRALGRTYPVLVDFQPIGVKLTVPAYRNCFYPGQDASRVAGRVTVAGGAEATVAIEGPGFRRQETRVSGAGDFAFDTRGFRTGEAVLTVAASGETRTVCVRNLPPSGHRMVWIEDGHLVVDGRPVLRRNVYADGWMCGKPFLERYARDAAAFCKTPEFERFVDLSPERILPGIEKREATRDVRPCAEYFRKVDEILERNRDADFGYYYLVDEPECRHVSPVWLRHAYEHIAEKDPYHPVLTATRAGKAYIDCVDWAETHPYLDCYNADDGTRRYRRPPNEVGNFLDAFEASGRPDKAIGFLPTCFAYRWQSIRNDYPTFDEYVLHTWAAMMRGGKSLWPYAGHDLGDRPALYEGTKYVFSSFAALEDLVLLGRRTTLVKSPEEEAVLYELRDERMFVVVNFTDRRRTVTLSGLKGTFREFRGARTFDGRAIELAPLETVVACTKKRDRGLPSLDEVRRIVVRDEAARKGRDNQLRGRYEGVVFTSNMKLRADYKMIDGVRDMTACYAHWMTNAYLEASFTQDVPRFSKLRLWGVGDGLDALAVSVRKNGAWTRLMPRNVTRTPESVELDFGGTVSTVKLRLDFPGPKGRRNDIELYELELPRDGSSAAVSEARRPPAAADEDVRWRLDGCVLSEHTTKSVPLDPASRWFVLDVAAFHEKSARGYRAWQAYLDGIRYLGGTVTSPQAGIYTFRLPENLVRKSCAFKFYTYGLAAEFNSIALMERPANRVELDYTNGVARVRAFFAAPCEDVSAEFLVARSTGGLNPFPVNGTHGLELRALDETRRIWGADVAVKSCGQAKSGQVFVKVSALGGGPVRPLFGNFASSFGDLTGKAGFDNISTTNKGALK